MPNKVKNQMSKYKVTSTIIPNSPQKNTNQSKAKSIGKVVKKSTIKKNESGSLDNPIKSPLNSYNNCVLDIKNNNTLVGLSGKNIRKQKFNRMIGVKNDSINESYVSTIFINEEYTVPLIKLNNEAIPFLFHLNGCAKNLLLFIIANLLDTDNGTYRANTYSFTIFLEHSLDFYKEKYKLDTIRQCHRELVEKNIICNVSTSVYKINPLIVSIGNETKKRQQFKEYTELLIRKGRDPVKDFYPKFSK
jgi:hypothetical protein